MAIARLAQAPPPSPERARWSFFRPSKTTFSCVLQNQAQINFDNKNDYFCDENSHIFDDYGDENDQKKTNTMPFKSIYTPFRHNYLVKKRTKSTGQGSTPHPPPQTGNAQKK